MSMEFKGNILDLKKCPECKSIRIEIAKYPDGKKFLECNNCYSVIGEIKKEKLKVKL